MDKVKIISMVNRKVVVSQPDLHFKRTWANRGAEVTIARDVLDELIYTPGFKYMIDTGILYIEDMQVKKDLGVEPEEADKPVNIIVLSSDEQREFMTTMSFTEFKERVANLSIEQVRELADFAINNRYMDYDKCKFIKDKYGRDIIRAIELKALNEEPMTD